MKNNKNWVLGLVVLVILVAGFSYLAFRNNSKNVETKTATVEATNYFSDDANVWYFYTDTCSWCIKEKDVLTRLGDEGYRVKSMNIGKDASLWETYKISGTPTFVAGKGQGERAEGYQEYDALKTFLDKNK